MRHNSVRSCGCIWCLFRCEVCRRLAVVDIPDFRPPSGSRHLYCDATHEQQVQQTQDKAFVFYHECVLPKKKHNKGQTKQATRRAHDNSHRVSVILKHYCFPAPVLWFYITKTNTTRREGYYLGITTRNIRGNPEGVDRKENQGIHRDNSKQTI